MRRLAFLIGVVSVALALSLSPFGAGKSYSHTDSELFASATSTREQPQPLQNDLTGVLRENSGVACGDLSNGVSGDNIVIADCEPIECIDCASKCPGCYICGANGECVCL